MLIQEIGFKCLLKDVVTVVEEVQVKILQQ